MFKQSDNSIVERARRFAPAGDRPGIAEPLEPVEEAQAIAEPTTQFHPMRAALQQPADPAAVDAPKPGPESVVRSIRSDVMERLGSQPASAFVAEEGLSTRLRRRYAEQGNRLLAIGGAVAVAIVALVLVIPVLSGGHSSSKSPTPKPAATAAAAFGSSSFVATAAASPTKQPTAGATPSTGFRGSGPVLPTPQQGAAVSTPPAAAGSPGAGYVQVNAPRPSTTPPVTRARSAPFQPPSAAGAANPNQPPPVAAATPPDSSASLTNIVTNAAGAPPPVQVGSSSPGVVPSRSSAPPVAASSGGSGTGFTPSGSSSGGSSSGAGSSGGSASAAAPVQAAPPEPAAVAPAFGSLAASAQKAATAANSHNQPAGH